MLSEIDIEKLPSYRIGEIRGEAKGEARGEENERVQMIIRASAQGFDVQTIAKLVNLSIQEVNKVLLSNNKNH